MNQDWELTPEKFLNANELSSLMKKADELYVLGTAGRKSALVRDWFLIYTALFTGLRRAEMCNLRVEDVHLGNGQSHIVVRNGKGGKSRVVHIGKEYKAILKKYLHWKDDHGELSNDAYLLRTERAPSYSVSGLWRRWKKYCPKKLHSARHTFGTFAYQATKNLRLVQKQLGHSKITTTQIYADVTPDIISTGMDEMEKLTRTIKHSRTPAVECQKLTQQNAKKVAS
jgi:integrase